MVLNDSTFIRKRFKFEAEYGQHRNWWVRDARIAGNPLTIYLFLLSHDPQHMPTQTEALKALNIGRSAWQAAKERLLQAGFMMEIRDRYPSGYVDSEGRPKGGQKRFRLELLDPEPNTTCALSDMVIELDIPLEEYEKTPGQNQCEKSAVADSSQCRKSAVDTKPLVNSSAENQQWVSASADNQQSFIGRENGLVRFGSNNQPTSTEPTNAGARESAEQVDAQLAALLPTVQPPLTCAAIAREVDGRLDLGSIDLVQAVTDTVLRQRRRIENPAAYVASVLVRKPTAWLVGSVPLAPGAFNGSDVPSPDEFEPLGDRERAAEQSAACARGQHDWGPVSWPEIDRAHCTRRSCIVARRTVDEAFAELEEITFEGSL